jgi:hypothetical protein
MPVKLAYIGSLGGRAPVAEIVSVLAWKSVHAAGAVVPLARALTRTSVDASTLMVPETRQYFALLPALQLDDVLIIAFVKVGAVPLVGLMTANASAARIIVEAIGVFYYYYSILLVFLLL